jgi:hypothetical protein
VGAGTETGKIAFLTMFGGAAANERLGIAADVTVTLPEAAGANSFILTDSVPVTKLSVNSLGNLTSKNNQAAATGVTWNVSKSRAADAACTADDVILQTDGIASTTGPLWHTVTSARHIVTNIGAGTEAGAILFLTMTAGAAVSEKFRISDVLNNSVQNFAVNTDYFVETSATGDVAQKNIEVEPVTHTVTKARAAAVCVANDVIWQLTCTGMNSTPAQHEAVNLKVIMTAVGVGAEAGAFTVETVIGGAAIAEAFRVGTTVNSVLNLTVATDYFVVTAATGDMASKNIEVDATGVTYTVTKARAAAVAVANDVIWQLTSRAMNSTPAQTTVANLKTLVTDPTAGTEDGAFTVETAINGAVAERFRVGATVNVVPNFTVGTDYLVVTSTTGDIASKNIEVDATGVTWMVTKARAAAACSDNDVALSIVAQGMNDAPALHDLASIDFRMTDASNGAEDGELLFKTVVNSSGLGTKLSIADIVACAVDFTVNTTGFVVDIDGNISLVPFTGIVDVTGQVRTTGDMRIGRMQWEDDFIEAGNLIAATTLTKLFWTGTGASGTQTVTVALNGTMVLATGAGGNQTSILTFTHAIFDTDAAPSMEFRIKSDLLTNRRVAAGFWASANDYLYFLFDTAINAANIYIGSNNNAGGEQTTDTTVDLVNNTYFIGRIEIAADETFKFFINNVEVAAAHGANTIRQLATFVPYFYIDNKAIAVAGHDKIPTSGQAFPPLPDRIVPTLGR